MQLPKPHTRRSVLLIPGLVVSLLSGLALGEPSAPSEASVEETILDRALEKSLTAQRRGAASQVRVELLDDEAKRLLERFRALTTRLETEQQFNSQLSARTSRQAGEIAAIERQLRDLSQTEREIAPLLERMHSALVQFVELDVPFLREERALRLETLGALLKRSETSLAEKFRRLLSAYQVEVDYGRTLEAYQARLPIAERPVMVHVLRFGRVGLYYMSLDEQTVGHWNRELRRWQPLLGAHRAAVRRGLAVARHQSPPELLPLPVSLDATSTES